MEENISQWDGQVAMPADPQAANEAWVSACQVAERNGYKQRYRKAASTADVSKMREQNRAISRRTFGMPDGYERIQWSKPA